MKEIVIVNVPDKVLERVEQVASHTANNIVSHDIQQLRREVRKEITELKTELFKAGLVPQYQTAYKQYDNFEDRLIVDKFEDMINDLSLKTGRSPRALRIRIKTLGLLGV